MRAVSLLAGVGVALLAAWLGYRWMAGTGKPAAPAGSGNITVLDGSVPPVTSSGAVVTEGANRQAGTVSAGNSVAPAAGQAPKLCNNEVSPRAPTADGRLFGHFAYAESAPGDLIAPPKSFQGPNCQLVHKDMLAAINAMSAAAAKDDADVGKALIGVSCFRSIKRQAALFCDSTKLKARGYEGQAHWIAPPGYSEHATGYAIDFGARTLPRCHAEPCFKDTRTGQWLAKNARKFGFEMSFPEGNGQGVNPEPWHFRFVGAPKAAASFTRANAAFPAR